MKYYLEVTLDTLLSMGRDIVDHRLLGALHLKSLNRQGFQHDPAHEHTAFQVGTLDALMHGRFDGDVTLGEVLQHGDMGLGTIQHLGGELIILAGESFLARADGSVIQLGPRTKTPFAVVTQFTPRLTASIEEMYFSEFFETIDQLAGAPDEIMAIRIDGCFSNIELRSVHEQKKPYPLLSEVVNDQSQWNIVSSIGSVVGFRFPDYASGLEVPGYHVHFISEDRTIGGHVVSIDIDRAVLSVDHESEFHVELPEGIDLGIPGIADRAEIRRIEGGLPRN